jgi:adenylate kinase family enzyme
VQRVSVVGTSGAGKSTVAAALAGLLGASFLELDSVHHQADWTPLPRTEFRALVTSATAGERWVIDGNYSSVQDIVWARADTVVWLDLPRRTVMRRVIWRTLRRIGGRVELWNGNRERWRNLFSLDKEESVIAWAWQTHAANRARYEAAMADPVHDHLRFVRLRSVASVRQFLQSVEAAPSEPVPGSGGPLGRGQLRRSLFPGRTSRPSYPTQHIRHKIVVDPGLAVDWWRWGTSNQPRSPNQPRKWDAWAWWGE